MAPSRPPDPAPDTHRRPAMKPATSPDPSRDRPKNRATEYEDQKDGGGGAPPRPASEPQGAERSVSSAKTAVDPGSGAARNTPDPKTTTPPGRKGP